MDDRLTDLVGSVDAIIGDRADDWDLAGRIDDDAVTALARGGLLCPQVSPEHGGHGLSHLDAGMFTARMGERCSSARSLLTSHGMAASVVDRFGDDAQRRRLLTAFTSGETAAVAFSEPGAGSDLAAMTTVVRRDGTDVRITGRKTWITGTAYASHVVVFGRFGDGGAAVVVPLDAVGVTVTPVPNPSGCRAAGHCDIAFDDVRLPSDALLFGAGMPMSMLVTTALTHGRMSVAWGCVGIATACREHVVRHSSQRVQFGRSIAGHQLVAEHVAEIYVAERTARLACVEAAEIADARSPEVASAAVFAKHVAARSAARASRRAVQVLASAGARDGHPVARAHRDAKLMEIIEGSNEMCTVLLADRAAEVTR